MQGEIARDVLNKLRVKLSGEEERSLSEGYTQNAEAYRLYLTGRHLLNNGTSDGLQGGSGIFSRPLTSTRASPWATPEWRTPTP